MAVSSCVGVLRPSFTKEQSRFGDADKRVRGRRGLDFVKRLQNTSGAVRIDDTDFTDIDAVDTKLVRLARDRGAFVVTTDHTLNKVAEIQGVKVLNVNDLANSVKPAVLPGEVIEVKILREGREQDQGVGYLDDGTMIVVELRGAARGLARQGRGHERAAEPIGERSSSRACCRLAARGRTRRGTETWRISRPERPWGHRRGGR